MTWIVVAIGIAIFGVLIFVTKQNEKKAIEQGVIIKRKHEFFKQAHHFKTCISDIACIQAGLNVSVFEKYKIGWQVDANKGKITFFNNVLGGSFVAALRHMKTDESGRQIYCFQVEKWQTKNGMLSAKDELGVNVVLTALEKSFLRSDPSTAITRTNATYKSKTPII